MPRILLIAVAAAAAFVSASPASAGPVASAVRAMCVPWIGGAPAKPLADSATRAGFKPKWTGEHLESIELPKPAIFEEEITVQLRVDRFGCTIWSSYSDPRAREAVLADIDTFVAAPSTPDFRFVKASDQTVGGRRTIVYKAPGADLVIRDMLDPIMGSVAPNYRYFEVMLISAKGRGVVTY